MPPVVSVLLPVFNGSLYLREAIESVRAQSLEDFELIVCDDVSKDGSAEIVRELARQDSRIFFFANDSRRGLFGNYNECLKRATGKYIKPFAQDDVLAPGALKAMRQIFDDHAGVVLASCGCNTIGALGESLSDTETPIRSSVPASQPVDGRLVINKSLAPLLNFIGEPVRVMFRRYAAGDGFDEKLYQLGDLEYWLRILRLGSYYFTNEELCSFRKHPSSASASNVRTLRFAPDMLRIADKFEHEVETAGFSKDEYIAECTVQIARHVAYLDDTGELQESEILQAAYTEESRDVDASFRQLAFHSLRLLGKEMPIEGRGAGQSQLTHLVRHRERTLRNLLSSRSWRWTRLFREFKRMLKSNSDNEPLLDAMEVQDNSLFRTLLYLRYLREKILSVRASSSWLVTSPLRQIGF